MRSHESCEEEIAKALAHHRDGYAFFLAERCDVKHGELTRQAITHDQEDQ